MNHKTNKEHKQQNTTINNTKQQIVQQKRSKTANNQTHTHTGEGAMLHHRLGPVLHRTLTEM